MPIVQPPAASFRRTTLAAIGGAGVVAGMFLTLLAVASRGGREPLAAPLVRFEIAATTGDAPWVAVSTDGQWPAWNTSLEANSPSRESVAVVRVLSATGHERTGGFLIPSGCLPVRARRSEGHNEANAVTDRDSPRQDPPPD